MTTAPSPFLVARGRRAGYAILLAPADLAGRDRAVLLDRLRPGAAPDVTEVTTPSGRRLTVVHATHRVTERDLGDGQAPLDEHGRPLDLLHGYVCRRTRGLRPDQRALARTLADSLAVYRDFLSDEEGFTVRGAAPVPAASAPGRRVVVAAVAVMMAALALVAGFLLWSGLDRAEPCPAPDPPAVSHPPATSPSPGVECGRSGISGRRSGSGRAGVAR